MIRVAIVDDHPLMREGIRAVLAKASDVLVVGAYANGHDFLREHRNHRERLDVVLLDLTMPKSDGFDVLVRLRSWRNPPPVLILSMHPERTHAREVMSAGAHGYVTKDVDDEVLVRAVRTVAAGETFLSPEAHAGLLTEPETDATPSDRLLSLSDQERRVFRLIRHGLTAKEIGRELDIAPSTVSTHKQRLMEKLGATSLPDLFRYSDTLPDG
jgi:DNA-binding NarL/FixJ family response regulator